MAHFKTYFYIWSGFDKLLHVRSEFQMAHLGRIKNFSDE